MTRSYILGASTLLNVLIQHLPLQSFFWSTTKRACGALDPSKDTSVTREAPQEETKHYNLRRNARIRCHPYEVNNMMILTKKFKNISLEDIYISKDFEDMKRSKPMKIEVPPLNP